MLPDQQSSPEQRKIWQAMSGVEKLHVAEQMWWAAREKKIAEIWTQHPDWTKEQAIEEVRQVYLQAARNHPW